ncbi:MAG: NADH-quinone oxidoreductase subunit NuoK [Planctomycetota bacterium]|jgi:NADH:ubiquinone oxidoreductase subunit K|nr:NADH-quinone oxidoreductase subunit NuoK [Planctomycetota bacterium]
MIDPINVQILAAILFGLGIAVVLTRRNIFFTLMGIELLLNAVNLSFVGFSRTFPADAGSITGIVAPLFVIAIAAAEACVGLAMVISLVRGRNTLDTDAYAGMRE